MATIMNKPKEHVLKKGHSRRGEKIISGSLEYLTNYFSYTLMIGNSHDHKINKNPKTIKGLVSALNKSFEIIEASCYERTYISLGSKEEK